MFWAWNLCHIQIFGLLQFGSYTQAAWLARLILKDLFQIKLGENKKEDQKEDNTDDKTKTDEKISERFCLDPFSTNR